MKQLFAFLLLFIGLHAGAQTETIGKRNGTVVVQNDLQVTGDTYIGFKDTTGAQPSRLGVIRWRPLDALPYVYVSSTGRKWKPLVPITGDDILYASTGLYFVNNVLKGKLASTVDTGMLTPTVYQSILLNTNKRVVDVQFSGSGTTKSYTLSFNDGTQIVRSYTDDAGTGTGTTITSTGLGGLFSLTPTDDGNGTTALNFGWEQQSPYTVLARGSLTGQPQFQPLSAAFITSGTFDPARLPAATASASGILSAADYNRLFTRQYFSNPSGTVTIDVDQGGQAVWQISSTGARTLAFTHLRTGDRFKLAINNSSGATMTLTLPSLSYVQGSGLSSSLTIPTGRSALSLIDYDGSSSWFQLLTF